MAIAEAHLGQGNFLGTVGPWCADFVSFVLRAAGRKPLANRLAASALAYGPREPTPTPGDLVVMRTRRGAYGHVGIVIAVDRATVEIVSGNWSHRVARARIARGEVTAFVRV
ncbi:MAG: CHAP domain-containing protein [Rhodomicrobium sp.]